MRNKLFGKVFPNFGKKNPLHIFESLRIQAENEALQFWKVYFDLGYFFLFIPFRFRFNRVTGAYELYTNLVQKILRIVGAALAGFYFLMKVRQMYSESRANPSMYFDIVCYFFDTFFLLPMFLTLGRQSHVIDQVFQELQQSQYARSAIPRGVRKTTKRITQFFCLICICHPLLYICEALVKSGWNPKETFKFFQRDAWRVFGLMLSTLPNPKEPIILGAFSLLSFFANLVDKLINTYGDIMFLLTVLMFRELVKHFTFSLRSPDYVSPVQVLEHYRWLKGVTERINEGMGIITISFILGNLPFFATSILTVFIAGSNFERLVNMTVTLYFFGSLFLAAKATRDVEEVKQWLCKEETYTRIHPLKLTVVLQEVASQPVSLSAFGCITVNYGTVGSIVSIIFTYALLKQQFQSEPA